MRKNLITVALIAIALSGCASTPGLKLYEMADSDASLAQIQALVDTPEFQRQIKTNDWDPYTAPQCAFAEDDKYNQVLALLIKAGIDVNVCPGNGGSYTPLMTAAADDAPKNLKLLLNSGADVNVRNFYDQTAYDVAVDEGDSGILKVFSDFSAMQVAWTRTSHENTREAFLQYLHQYPEGLHTADAKGALARLAQAAEERAAEQAKLAKLEAQLPAGVRYDKYMVRLSALLKTQQYEKALPVFAQIEQLATRRDPSFDYFYGESLLKTGRYQEAVTRLYKYIKEQGSGAKHYAESLDLINQAEAKL